ncbi:MAG: protein BatD [Candidatus Riflebacteria bacterium]|nr:protein BatD [Candidatus Riflebacteria bacterium]
MDRCRRAGGWVVVVLSALVLTSVTYSLEVSVAGGSPGNQPPEVQPVDGLKVLTSGASDQIQVVNGEMSHTRVHQYALLPQRAGTFTIPPAKIEVNGKVHQSSPVTVKVLAGQGPGAQPQGAGVPDETATRQPPQSQPPTDANALFLKARVSRREIYQGEPVVYSSRLYSQYRLGDRIGLKEEASFQGFLVEGQQATPGGRVAVEGGVRYQVVDVSRKILVPTRPGTLEIKPETLQVPLVVRTRRATSAHDPFGSLFDDDDFGFPLFSRQQIVNKFVTAPPIPVTVMPLPAEGRPASFAGAVGTDFYLTSAQDKDTLKENETFTLKVTVAGNGDVRTVGEPKLSLGPDFKLFPTKSTPKLEVKEAGLSGSRVFEFLLAPRSPGEKVIPGVEFTYFDTARRTYVTKRTAALKVTVVAGEKEEVLSSANFRQSSEVKVLGRDIQFIKEAGGALEDVSDLARSPSFLLANLLPVLALVGVWLIEARRRRLEQDVPWARRSRAAGRARAGLAALAARPREEQTLKTVLVGLEEVLLGYLADKLNRSAAGLVVGQIEEQLSGRAVDPALMNRLKALLAQCEQMRYAPASAGPGADSTEPSIKTAEELIGQLEEVL